MFFVWRSNLLGSSGKGQEYFLRHLLGATHDGPLAEPLPEGERPAEVRWRDEIPHGKLDLLVNVDFRMTTTGLYSDIVLPGRHLVREARPVDDRHAPVRALVQPGGPAAVGGAHRLGHVRRDRARFSELAAEHLGVRRDIVAARSCTTRRARSASRAARSRDWRAGECEPVPGRTMPVLTVVERDYGAVAEQWAALGPLAEQLGSTVKSASWIPDREVEQLAARNGRVRGGAADGRPSLGAPRAGRRDDPRALGRHQRPPRGRRLPLAGGALRRAARRPRRGRRGDADHLPGHAGAAAPRDHLAGVVGHRRGGPRLRRVHDQRRARQALAHAVGRMHLYLDHAWMRELGEALPAYRPPVDHRLMLAGAQPRDGDGVPR